MRNGLEWNDQLHKLSGSLVPMTKYISDLSTICPDYVKGIFMSCVYGHFPTDLSLPFSFRILGQGKVAWLHTYS